MFKKNLNVLKPHQVFRLGDHEVPEANVTAMRTSGNSETDWKDFPFFLGRDSVWVPAGRPLIYIAFIGRLLFSSSNKPIRWPTLWERNLRSGCVCAHSWSQQQVLLLTWLVGGVESGNLNALEENRERNLEGGLLSGRRQGTSASTVWRKRANCL